MMCLYFRNHIIIKFPYFEEIHFVESNQDNLIPYLTWPGFVESQSNLTPALLKPVLVKIVYFSLSKVSMSLIWSEQFENLSDASNEGLRLSRNPVHWKWLEASGCRHLCKEIKPLVLIPKMSCFLHFLIWYFIYYLWSISEKLDCTVNMVWSAG